MDIIKAKIVNDFNLEVEYKELVECSEDYRANIEVSKKIPYEVHDDLKSSFSELTVHLALLCELLDPSIPLAFGLESDATKKCLDGLKVTGFSIGGTDEHEGVTIIGRKNLKSKKVLNLVAPFTKWEDENMPYSFSSELYSSVHKAISEVVLYIEGKKKPSNQLELEFSK